MHTSTGVCPIGDHPFEYVYKGGQRPVSCARKHRNAAAVARKKVIWATLVERRCSRCRIVKPISEYPGPHGYCRACHAARAREYREVVRYDPLRARQETLKRYGLTLDTFDELLASQDGKCAVCRTPEPGGQGWHVDHDHTCCRRSKCSCGKCVRGILCTRCNIGIGNFKDDPAIIQAAHDYITAYRARQVVVSHVP